MTDEKQQQIETGAAEAQYDFSNVDQLTTMYGENVGTSGYKMRKATMPSPVKNSLAMIGWINRVADKATKSEIVILIDEGVKHLESNVADFNSFKHLVGYADAEWAINIGKFLNKLKPLVKKAGHFWEVWSEQNLPFIGERNRAKFMKLARREDCHRFSIFGVDRLDVLCSATEKSKDKDRIGSFLERHGIKFDPTAEFNLDEFKNDVDTALNRERLVKNEIAADDTLVRDLTLAKLNFDKSLIQKLKYVKDSGGDVNVCLKTLSLNRGHDPAEAAEEKKLKDFNSLSSRLIRTIDALIKSDDDEDIERVDPKTLKKLQKKLDRLMKLTPADTGEVEVEEAEEDEED